MALFRILACAGVVLAAPFEPTWESVTQHATPAWYPELKFGMYAHFSLFSVPAFENEWYSRDMYYPGASARAHHEATYGPVTAFGYKDFAPAFTAPAFNATAWARLYRRAGAQFAGPMAEHADGFAMYNSSLSNFTAVRMGPERDVAGEIAAAVRAEGLKLITTLHHQWLWAWYPTWNASVDCGDAAYQMRADGAGGLYGPRVAGPEQFDAPNTTQAFQDYWLGKVREVIRLYEPDVLYFDGKVRATVDDAHRLAYLSEFYNLDLDAWGGKGVVVTYKLDLDGVGDLAPGAGVLDIERGGFNETVVRGDGVSYSWQTEDSMDRNSWSWVEPPSLRNATLLIGELVDVVSKNGNFVLNAPPKADGSFDARVVATLEQIGDWLALNGMAIYATTHWGLTFGEGPTKIESGGFHEYPLFTPRDFRFTANARCVFSCAMAWADDGYAIAALNASAPLLADGDAMTDVSLVGASGAIAWSREADALRITVPEAATAGLDPELPLVFRIHVDGATADDCDAASARYRSAIHQA